MDGNTERWLVALKAILANETDLSKIEKLKREIALAEARLRIFARMRSV